MPAGQQPTIPGLNGSLTGVALRLRDVCRDIANLNQQIGNLGTSGLIALGTDSPTATDMVNSAAQMNTVAAVYFGTATQATTFDFNDACSSLWGGQ